MPAQNPGPSNKSPAELAEEERLRKELAELQSKVQRESRTCLVQLDSHLARNKDRSTYYERLIGKISAFISEIESGPSRPGDETLLEKLRASRDLYQASRDMVEIQSHDYRRNQEAIRNGMDPAAPVDLTVADSTKSKAYRLAVAKVDVAGARLLAVDFWAPMHLLKHLLDPNTPLPSEIQISPERRKQLQTLLAESPEIKPLLSQAISHYQDLKGLIKEANRALRGVGEYAWEVSHLEGNTSHFVKLRGKLFYLERLAEQLEPYPELARLFAKPTPEPLPFGQAPGRSSTGKLKPPSKATKPLGKQTRRMGLDGNPFAERK